MRLASGGFGPQHAPESLRFFLPRTKCAGHLNEDLRVGQIKRKVAHFGQHQQRQLARAEEPVQPLAFALWRLSRNQWGIAGLGNLFNLVQILPNNQCWGPRVSC